MGKHLERLGGDEQLGGGRIFSIERRSDGKFRIREECDGYFWLDFTADELRELAKEIIELADIPEQGQ